MLRRMPALQCSNFSGCPAASLTSATCQPLGTDRSKLNRFSACGSIDSPPSISCPLSETTNSRLPVTAISAGGLTNRACSAVLGLRGVPGGHQPPRSAKYRPSVSRMPGRATARRWG